MENQEPSLVETVSETVSTDTVLDIKNGIYNLFLSLVNSQVITHGLEGSLQEALGFLQEIIHNFNKVIESNQEQ